MNKRLFAAIVLCILLLQNTGKAANAPTGFDLFRPMPPSPNVASLLRYTDVPVNLSTGTAQFSIPIYEINTGSLKLPVVLRYTAGSGIRVTDDAGSVGLGWSLQAEGVITRTSLGLRDNGSWQSNGLNWLNSDIDPGTTDGLNLLNALSLRSTDGIPDIYTYSVGGLNGKFIVANQIKLLPQKNVGISYVITSGGTYEWEIVGEDGTHYFFKEEEKMVQKAPLSIDNSSQTWYLTEIRSANGTDFIKFKYANTFYEATVPDVMKVTGYEPFANYPGDIPLSGNGIPENQIGLVTGKQLYEIEFNNGKIEYDISWNVRADHSSAISGRNVPMIRKVIVRNKDNKIIKAVHLAYDYYNQSASNFIEKRLRLIELRENSSATTGPDDLLYTFEYNPQSLPSRVSYAMDHWGYYNGANGNQTLIPSQTIPAMWVNPPTCLPGTSSTIYSGANREPNAAVGKAGILERVNYPMGGNTQFEYEANTIPHPDPFIYFYSTDQYNVSFTQTSPANVEGDAKGFTIPSGSLYSNGVCVELTATLSANSGVPVTSGGHYVRIMQGATVIHNIYLTGTSQVTETVNLPSGTYALKCFTQNNTWQMTGLLKVHMPHEDVPADIVVGGQRIKKITHNDQYANRAVTPGRIVKKYEYKTPGSVRSSGQLFRKPFYEIGLVEFLNYCELHVCPPGSNGTPCWYEERRGISRSSNTSSNINAGNHIIYPFVREILGENAESGYSQYQFTDFEFIAHGDEMDQSWRRGLLLSKKDYDVNNQLVHELTNTYSVADVTRYAGHLAFEIGKHECASLVNPQSYPWYFFQRHYSFPSEWLVLTNTTEKDYNLVTPVATVKKFYYDNMNHKAVTRLSTSTSDGREMIQNFRYPQDFNLPATGSLEIIALKAMQDQHIHDKVIETFTTLYNPSGGTTVTVDGEFMVYDKQPNNWIVPINQYKLRTTTPLTNYAAGNGSSGTMIRDNRYTLEGTIGKYDDGENAVEIRTIQGNAAYIYDYDKKYMTAKVSNATERNVAFSSFETSETGNWTFNVAGVSSADKLTGNKCYNLSSGGSISKTGLGTTPPHYIDANVIVSYWKKSGDVTVNSGAPTITGMTINGWTYCEHKILGSSSVTISGNALVDEVRLYPVGSQMESYTYDPLVGMTSNDDAGSHITFYQYDNRNRLFLIKDQYGNITKKIEYAYQKAE